MTPQQKIAERLYELLPHKKELEFGCEIQNKSSKAVIRVIKEKFDGTLMITDWDGWHTKNWIKENFEIIGQPIRLADILLAIEIANKRYISLTNSEISITSNGIIIDDSKNEYSRVTDYEYNLEKDNILEQSDLLCNFLYDILDQ